ncbi:hypothetical protein HOG48_01020 [Candidatus Peregrinibacteria bacterium]|nr:hypothetical protein [Candidatus Peregrinibacteria bacterium]
MNSFGSQNDMEEYEGLDCADEIDAAASPEETPPVEGEVPEAVGEVMKKGVRAPLLKVMSEHGIDLGDPLTIEKAFTDLIEEKSEGIKNKYRELTEEEPSDSLEEQLSLILGLEGGLTEAQKRGILIAHFVGLAEGRHIAESKEDPDGYTFEDISDKTRILREHGFETPEQRRILIEDLQIAGFLSDALGVAKGLTGGATKKPEDKPVERMDPRLIKKLEEAARRMETHGEFSFDRETLDVGPEHAPLLDEIETIMQDSDVMKIMSGLQKIRPKLNDLKRGKCKEVMKTVTAKLEEKLMNTPYIADAWGGEITYNKYLLEQEEGKAELIDVSSLGMAAATGAADMLGKRLLGIGKLASSARELATQTGDRLAGAADRLQGGEKAAKQERIKALNAKITELQDRFWTIARILAKAPNSIKEGMMDTFEQYGYGKKERARVWEDYEQAVDNFQPGWKDMKLASYQSFRTWGIAGYAPR